MNQREKMSDKERYKLDMEQLYSHWKLKEPAIRFVPTKSGEGEKIIINHRNNIFISDGVVFPELWYSQNVRILFLLNPHARTLGTTINETAKAVGY